jgi:hypothetical protein
MKLSLIKQRYLPIFGFGLIIYMPFHLLLSRWLSLYTGGLMVWEVGKDILTLIALIISIYVIIKNNLLKNPYLKALFVLSIFYGLIHLVFLLSPIVDRHAVIVATTYNGRLIAYLFIGIAATTMSDKNYFNRLQKLIIIISTITVIIAIFQYLLPKDLMTHFGYSIERGAKPNFFIDDKPQFPRLMSTLRDPNSYGAYLIFPITLLWISIINNYKKNKSKFLVIILLAHFIVLFLTYSRSALIGVIASMGISTAIMHTSSIKKILRKYLKIIPVIMLVLGVGLVMGQKNTIVQNIIFHSDRQTVEADPNEKRIAVQKQAIENILRNPEGHSPGTAGQVAFSNRKLPGIITENYYLQIAYEVGLVGLLVFVCIIVLTYLLILSSRDTKGKALLLSTLWGYLIISFLTHLWSNEAVSVQWWFTSGVMIGQSVYLNRAGKAATG